MHLHACVTDGVFERRVAGGGVTFHAARPLIASDLAAVTQRVRLRLVRWFRRKGFLSREAAADMLTWQHSGFSVDASVRISLADRDVPVYFQSLEHLLRYCARPAFALNRLQNILADRPQVVTALNMGVWLVFHQENVPDPFCAQGSGAAEKGQAPFVSTNGASPWHGWQR